MLIKWKINPIRLRSFQSFARPGGGGGSSEVQMPKINSYHKLIEIKFCMTHYRREDMSDAKFESGSFSSFGDKMSQNSPLKKEQVIKFGYLPLENGLNFNKK